MVYSSVYRGGIQGWYTGVYIGVVYRGGIQGCI